MALAPPSVLKAPLATNFSPSGLSSISCFWLPASRVTFADTLETSIGLLWSRTCHAIPLHDGGLGRQFSQGLDGLARTVHGHVLQRMPQAEQEQQQRTSFPGTKRRRAGCGDDHQGVDIEAAARHALLGVTQGVETTRRIGAQQQAERQIARRTGKPSKPASQPAASQQRR